MLKRKSLSVVNSIKIIHDTSLEGIQRELCKYNVDIETYEPPLISLDKISIGHFFNKSIEDLLVINHPKHQNDYFKIGMAIFREKSCATLNIYLFGTSRSFSPEECINYLGSRYNRNNENLVLPVNPHPWLMHVHVHWRPLPLNKRDEIEWYLFMFTIIEDTLLNKYISK